MVYRWAHFVSSKILRSILLLVITCLILFGLSCNFWWRAFNGFTLFVGFPKRAIETEQREQDISNEIHNAYSLADYISHINIAHDTPVKYERKIRIIN